ncbi:hypothetical protein Ahu01nite_090730 [Winogradskya humida]|uniref:Uncharacterized protein n=2 Tax=Winogradskya humida TaxID=113566 RepID=A0ABQ4A553_9ACTN|nr:hypothetical protein Ahu01nite_090730 [Actinoplanes humidus]
MIAAAWAARGQVMTAVSPRPTWGADGTGNHIHAATGPAFPARLAGWRLAGEWHDSVRVSGTWTSLCGDPVCEPRFPATMNGCGNQRFLLRWRTVGNTTVDFGDGTVAADIGTLADEQLAEPTNTGWAELHGCGWPLWRTHDAPNNLVDIAVTLQQWVPTA